MHYPFLDSIRSPRDMKGFSLRQLEKLAVEIRQLLVETVSHTGGHLAPNLGVVELTLALHKVFDTPYDKIVWDVGHQAYVHKLLTGRREQFHTLRQEGGLSGFPKPCESPHDAFGTGHSSTSISAALGMALARDMNKETHQVVAVIGDGSMTGGESFEALNHAGHLKTNMIVVLNDNEMSIAKNVGALSSYLAKMRVAPTYTRVKQDVEFLLKRIPAIGESMLKTAERFKDSVRYMLVPGMLFEELGFTYLGPIDGHDLPLLMEMLEKARDLGGPVLIHALTQKGKGYAPAENHADRFHGVGPFCIDSGEVIHCAGAPSYTEVFGNTLVELAQKDQAIVAITAAMPGGTGLKSFSQKYPERFFDVGIAEQHALTLAAGMATQGKKPVVALYSTFAQRAYDQILHDVCLQKLPVVLALDRAGLVGEDGPTHHGVFDYSFLRHIPDICIMAPKDEGELRQMLYAALQWKRTVALRYPRGCGLGASLTEPLESMTLGKAEELAFGDDVSIWAAGTMVAPAVEAAQKLAAEGIRAGVVNARFVKPLDEKLLTRLAQECGRIVTIEENALAGGFGSAVLEFLEQQELYDLPVLRLGIPDSFIAHGKRQALLQELGLDAAGIAAKVRKFVKQGKELTEEGLG